MGIVTLFFGVLALRGSAWAKVLGVVEMAVGVLFILLVLTASAIR